MEYFASLLGSQEGKGVQKSLNVFQFKKCLLESQGCFLRGFKVCRGI